MQEITIKFFVPDGATECPHDCPMMVPDFDESGDMCSRCWIDENAGDIGSRIRGPACLAGLIDLTKGSDSK